MKTTKEKLIEAIERDCGEWKIPIDNVQGELRFGSKIEIWAIESGPAKEFLSQAGEKLDELERAFGIIQAAAREAQEMTEKRMPGHPIVGAFAEFEIKADQALASLKEWKEKL